MSKMRDLFEEIMSEEPENLFLDILSEEHSYLKYIKKSNEFLHEKIDEDLDNTREEWNKKVDELLLPINDFISSANKASTQYAILNCLLKNIENFRNEIIVEVCKKFEQEEKKENE